VSNGWGGISLRIWQYFEGSSSGVTEVLLRYLPGGSEKQHDRSQNIPWPCRDSNGAPPEYASTVPPLHQRAQPWALWSYWSKLGIMVHNYSINYGIALSRANLEMMWLFLHDSMCICWWRPLASCLQCQLYFEPCPPSSVETISLYTKCFVKYPNHIAQRFRIQNFKRFSKEEKSFLCV
jgi:hypothetical protein